MNHPPLTLNYSEPKFLTFNDDMLVGLSHAPDNDHCVQGATGHHEAVWTPGNTVDTSIVEAPFNLVEFFICGKSVDHHLETNNITTLLKIHPNVSGTASS